LNTTWPVDPGSRVTISGVIGNAFDWATTYVFAVNNTISATAPSQAITGRRTSGRRPTTSAAAVVQDLSPISYTM
jgi:hypothetical protein